MIRKDPPSSRTFFGVYARDKLPVVPKTFRDTSLILNASDSSSLGSHWLLVFIQPSKKKLTWFDSFGKHAKHYGSSIDEWIKSFGTFKVEANYSRQVQANNSIYCGLFVLYVLYFLSRGRTLTQILKTFSKHLKNNDRIVSRFAWKKFRFNALREIKL
ncbi:MAG: hypothetical protein GY804_04325 [Alphaproteobacteria bacterium]|nr:hypothetical protein [Alphaproteobacteria bacterium]